MLFDSGVRYHYGNITFNHSQIREDYLQNMLNIKSGDPYLVSDLSELTNDFSSTNWFSSVLLQPHVREEDKLVDIELLLYPRKKNSMELGVGFATDTGPHVQIGWTNLGSIAEAIVSVQIFTSLHQNKTLKPPIKCQLLKNPLNYYYEFQPVMKKKIKTIRIPKPSLSLHYAIGIIARVGNILRVFVSVMTATHKLISPIKLS